MLRSSAGSFWRWGFRDGLGRNKLWVSYPISGHWWQFEPQKYRDRVLAPHVVPLLQKNHSVISVFLQDNARSHVARDNIQFLRNNNIDFIDDWPSKSPDLNPTEHLWDNLDTRDALLEEWNNIPQAQINNLIHSMRRRCQAVSNARDGHIRYKSQKNWIDTYLKWNWKIQWNW